MLHGCTVCVKLSRGPCGPEPVCATCGAVAPHVLEKMSESIERYHGSSCSCGQTGDRVCKEVQEVATLIVPLPRPSPTFPRHERPSQNSGTSTVCVFRSVVTSESLGARFGMRLRPNFSDPILLKPHERTPDLFHHILGPVPVCHSEVRLPAGRACLTFLFLSLHERGVTRQTCLARFLRAWHVSLLG